MKNKSSLESKKTILTLSFQNMLALASINIMLFLDRIMLAKFGKEYLNAAVTAGSLCNIFIFGAVAVVGVVDVFVGRYSGQHQPRKIGAILWQMIWFCALLAAIFLVIAQLGAPYLFSSSDLSPEAESYFRWQMSMGALPVLVSVLTSFFIGTRRFAFVLIAVLLANLTKLALQFPLVFGIEGYFPGLGIRGAVIATTIANLLHLIILAAIFFNASNRATYGTAAYKLQPQLFKKCMKLGIPQSMGTTINYSTWAIVVNMLAAAGEKHLMMYIIVDSFYTLLGFCTEAMQKAVMYITANLLGRNKSHKIRLMLTNSIWLLLFILGILGFPLLLFPQLITNTLEIGVLTTGEIYLACVVSWLYLSFEGITWILSGLLTALEDNLFVGPAYAIASIFFGVGGTYCLTELWSCDSNITCWVTVIYGLGYALLLLVRYKKMDPQHLGTTNPVLPSA